jgi:hypothetical protein
VAFGRCRKCRGGTPEGERVPLDASRTRWCGGLEKYAPFGVLLPSFLSSLRGAKRRSNPERLVLNTGLLRFARNDGLRTLIVMKPVTTTGFI